jgi:hypothetical protein
MTKISVDRDRRQWDSAHRQAAIGFHPRRIVMATEKDLIGAFESLVRRDFPNPQRVGCPGSEDLARFVARPSVPEFSLLLEHVRQCAPCFAELKKLQEGKK